MKSGLKYGALLMSCALVLSACNEDIVSPGNGEVIDAVNTGVVPIELTAGDFVQPPGTPSAQMKAILDQVAAANVRPLYTLTPLQARNQPTFADAVRAVMAAKNVAPAVEAVAKVEHRTLTSNGRTVLARIYTPAGTGPFPVVVYYHGGGFVITDLDDYDSSPRALANAAGAIVISVAYHQAPAFRFPNAHEDAFAAYRWALDSASAINGNKSKVAVAGESAGGNLAAAVCLMARDRSVAQPVYQLLVYPILDFNFETASYKENANAVPLGKRTMQWFFDKYLKSQGDANNPYMSPLRAQSVSGLAPATIINAQIDPLRSEGEAYADKLRAGGVVVDQTTYPGVTHEFFGAGAVLDAAKTAVAQAATGLKRGFGVTVNP